MAEVTREQAELIARNWLNAFNAKRPEQVVEHFAQDVTATSPAILRLRPQSGGTLRGRDTLREFYREGLALIPDLRFTLVGVLTGIDELTIVYRNQGGTLVAERLKLRPDGQVAEVSVTYGESAPQHRDV